MSVRALRGATTVETNSREEILEATAEMIKEIMSRNNLETEDMISILFTVTSDLDTVFPAVAVRQLGITDVPLLDVAQPAIKGALGKCIRVLIHFNTEKKNSELNHVYLRGAKVLRPDLVK